MGRRLFVTFCASVVFLSAAPMTVLSAVPASACTGDSVIVSMPLINAFTGHSSWNYGYVQLWYNYCTGQNWGRTVSEVSNTSEVVSDVYNNIKSTSSGYTQRQPWVVTSGHIVSPNNPAGAFGEVFIANSNDFYYAESDQSGANCEQDFMGGVTSCEP